MGYSSSEKLEIIGLVETPGLPVRRTLVQLGIPQARFYDGYRVTWKMVAMGAKTSSPNRSGSGTRFPRQRGQRLLSRRCKLMSYRRGNWPSDIPTRPGIWYRNRPFTDY